ncbi:uncharacterized protein LOC126964926 [Leptidea sinapis]|uniref:uncharacterized protein LOC126964926 n=1 Tax=Leptidea sinapis TaxID=189913 RepID=UPI0021C39D65|nr:uncharacterized protein LOC126964926 [Leptidea sinapis]XP_050664209.1 uncharacterized protein LOC126964926 [Leptidea sinapis]XP_050664210.1 uncharacterized protein LOC126964926 [Leptidea sinapis]
MALSADHVNAVVVQIVALLKAANLHFDQSRVDSLSSVFNTPSRPLADSPASPDEPSAHKTTPEDMEFSDSASCGRKRPVQSSSEDSDNGTVTGSVVNTSRLPSGEPFQLVQSRKKRQSKRSATSTDNVLSAPTPVPLMSLDISLPEVSITSSMKPATRCTPVLPANKPPPPIFIRDKAKWTYVAQLCADKKVQYTRATNTGEAIRVVVPTTEDFRVLTRLLTHKSVAYHTYALPEERKVKAILRGVPYELPSEVILEDLTMQGFKAEAVHKMYSRSGKKYPLALVILTNVPESREIFKRELIVCGLSNIRVEAPHRRGFPGQCHRCQLYGHAAANCSAPPRCVKCLEPHTTKECLRPACVLCGQEGHPANYRGCPRAPRHSTTKTARKQSSKPGPPPATGANFPQLRNRTTGPLLSTSWEKQPRSKVRPRHLMSIPAPCKSP